jgi:hypothetical protein
MSKEEGGVTSSPNITNTNSPQSSFEDNSNVSGSYKNLVIPEKPKLIVKYDNIPQVLKDMKRWMNWRFDKYTPSTGKYDKVPIGTEWNEVKNFKTFDEVKSICEASNNEIGLGIVIRDSNIVVFDVDGINKNAKFDTLGFKTLVSNTSGYYNEKSVYGGMHIFFLDKNHIFKFRPKASAIKCPDCDHIEVFNKDFKGFIAITGDTANIGNVEQISDPEIINIIEWVKILDGGKTPTPVQIVTKPLTLPNAPECYPDCIKNIIERLGKGRGVSHEQRLLLGSFLLNIGLNVMEVIEFFKHGDDWNPETTQKQILSIEKKLSTGGYSYSCKKVQTWKDEDKLEDICKHQCPLESFTKEVYVANIMNKQLGKTTNTLMVTDNDLINRYNVNFTKPFVFGLENSLYNEYLDYTSTQFDGFPEYNHATLTILASIIIDRKARLVLKTGTYYTNFWIWLAGKSSISRKSTAIAISREFDYIIKRGNHGEIPNMFTPESFVQILSKTSHAFFINDECQMLLKNVKTKSYMSDTNDIFLRMFSCGSFEKVMAKNRKTMEEIRYPVVDCYVNMLFATTPITFERYCDIEEIASGYMLRFLYYYPDYKKKRMGVEKPNKDDLIEKGNIGKRLDELDIFFTNLSEPIEFEFTKESGEFYNKWMENWEEKISNGVDDFVNEYFSRLAEYSLKLAMVYEILDNNFINRYKILNSKYGNGENDMEVKEDSGGFGIINTYPITLEKIVESCKEMDEYFVPMFIRVKDCIETGDAQNAQVKIRACLKNHGGAIALSELYRKTHLTKKEMETALEVLINETMELERVMKANESTKPTTYICMRRG